MSQVLNTYKNIAPGAVTRSIDAVIVALHNEGDEPIPFGAPVFLGENGGVTLSDEDSLATGFVGIAVRSPSKVPSEYGSGEASYEPNGIVDVLVRGSICVQLVSQSCDVGGAVYYDPANRTFETETDEDFITLSNVAWRTAADSGDGLAEIVVKTRNII